jgi:hypothetical protein
MLGDQMLLLMATPITLMSRVSESPTKVAPVGDSAPSRGKGKRRSEETVEKTRHAKVASEKGFKESEAKPTEKKIDVSVRSE